MKTYFAKTKSLKKFWYLIDARNKILGRLASKLSSKLRGKHRVEYTPHIDTGDYLVVLNASKILVTGKKYNNKVYYYHTGYPGGIKKLTFREMLIKNPANIIKIAVKGMLPKGSLGRSMLKKLKIYEGSSHPHIAQKLRILNI